MSTSAILVHSREGFPTTRNFLQQNSCEKKHPVKICMWSPVLIWSHGNFVYLNFVIREQLQGHRLYRLLNEAKTSGNSAWKIGLCRAPAPHLHQTPLHSKEAVKTSQSWPKNCCFKKCFSFMAWLLSWGQVSPVMEMWPPPWWEDLPPFNSLM